MHLNQGCHSTATMPRSVRQGVKPDIATILHPLHSSNGGIHMGLCSGQSQALAALGAVGELLSRSRIRCGFDNITIDALDDIPSLQQEKWKRTLVAGAPARCSAENSPAACLTSRSTVPGDAVLEK